MVSDVVLGALVGGGAAVAGSFVQAWFARQNIKDQISAENERRRAEHILKRETDALMELYRDTEKCHTIVQDYASTSSVDSEAISPDEYYDEVKPELRSLRSSIRQNGIFLSEQEQQEHFNPVLGQVRQADVEIEWRQNHPDRNPPAEVQMDWKKFIESFNSAREFMREKVRNRTDITEPD